MMEARIEALFKKAADYAILDKFLGETLKGLAYKPLFPYFTDRTDVNGFVVLTDDYVTEEAGTGVVHQAPYFGEVYTNIMSRILDGARHSRNSQIPKMAEIGKVFLDMGRRTFLCLQ